MSQDINTMVRRVHANAVSKGWYDGPERSKLEMHMLIVSEISEATEEVRNRKPHCYIENGKPEGEATELADAVIRIMDYFGKNGWDLEEVLQTKMRFNEKREYRHGNKAH